MVLPDSMTGPPSGCEKRTETSGRRAATWLMLGYWAVGLAAGLCFKEGGTSVSQRLPYFIVGNVLGISSTALLMGVYARMNVNLAMLIATSGAFVLFQLTLWAVYHTAITPVQWFGTLLVGVGMVLALRRGDRRAAAPVPEKSAPSAEEKVWPC